MGKKIAIIGSSGLIGSALKEHLQKYEIYTIPGRTCYESPELIARNLKGMDIIINLAGYPINRRWTKKTKELIRKSRIDVTSNLVRAISLLNDQPDHLINASAVGIYKDGILCDEKSNEYADNSLAKLVIEWEEAAKEINDQNTKLTIIRVGIVLSRNGGAYKLIRKIIKLGIGGKMGTGKQGYSFIIIDDLVRAIELIIDEKIYGIVNLVAPEPVDNFTFINEIAKKLNRPVLFALPAWIINIIFSEGSVFLLQGQKTLPGVLSANKFRFIGNNLKTCLEILEK